MPEKAGQIAFVVAPDGQAGGGMGRVKDILVGATPAEAGGLRVVSLITRGAEGTIMSAGRLAAALARIAVAQWRGRLAIVHVNLGDRGSAVRKGVLILLSRMIGAPVVLHLHAVLLQGDYARAPQWLRWLIRRPFLSASRVIVLGERWRHWLIDDLGIDDRKIDIVWNGVPTDPLLSARSAGGDRPLDILFVGNLLERKGVSDLLAALALLPPAPRAWVARFLGGGDVAHYRSVARSLGLSPDHVTFAGWVDYDDARSAIAAADLLVLPSYQEGLPLVILEALGLGTPVVCTAVGAIPEVLVDGDSALFCVPGDTASIAAAIRALIDDPALRRRLSERGMARFREQFSVDAFRREVFAAWRRARDPSAGSLRAAIR